MGNLSRSELIINGIQRAVLYDAEKDSLATALRRLGLTGIKVGCGTGVCGACTVILDGKVTRACVVRMKNVAEFSEILTIEGIGSPQNLHPLQQAWITYGGVQCGFCSPGFIVSAYGLLEKNPSPTREEVRAWFEKNRNLCRCTGYKPLVDAVMAAAQVMRGEKTMADITYSQPVSGGEDVYGSRLPRPTALPKVCGMTDFGDDIALKMPGQTAYLAPVMGGVPHARIKSIDTSEAEAVAGVFRVLTAADVKGSNDISFPAVVPRQKGQGAPKFPIICGETVKRRGDVVAVVAAATQELAREAAKKVKVELELLPAYMNILESAMPGAYQIHENIPNQYLFQPAYKGDEDIDDVFDDAAYVAQGSFHSQHEPHLPIEPDVFQGYWDEDGMLTIQSKTHDLYGCGEELAPAIGIDPAKVRMIGNPAGGCFGYSTISSVFALAGVAVMALNMPVSMTLTYAEHQHMTGKRSASYSNGRIAVDEDGKILAAEYDVALDHGPYAGTASIIFGNLVSTCFSGYNIPNFKSLARGGVSNHNFTCAYRGFGAPQIYTTSESLIDLAAEKAGVDPWEFRYKNAARPGDTTVNNRPYDQYVYPELLEKAKPVYDAYKAEAQSAKAAGRHVGVGISMGGFSITKGFIDSCDIELELRPDGGITHYNTWEDVGQGADIGTLTHTVKALEPLGIKPEQVRLVMNDTKKCPNTGLAAASRSHFVAGKATIDGANKLMNAMRKPDGTFRTYDEMIAQGIPTRYTGHSDEFSSGLDPCQDPNTGEGKRFPAWMNCVNLALVEVDVDTGKTQVLRYTSVADIGVIGNRLAVEGQAYGGLSHSIGFALSENYDATDRSGNMSYCGIPTITAIPDDYNVIFVENPRENGPHGSSGAAECFQCSNHMAVINAINNACGVRVYALPATPDKVKAGLEKLARGESLTPPKYFLGSEFEDELEYIRENPI